MDTAKVKLYRDLRVAEKQLGAQAKGIKEQADALEKELIEAYAEESVQSVKVDGSTVYLKRELWAGREAGVETPEILDALRAAGLSHFIGENFNSSTLSAYLRDLDENDEPLPAPLQGVVKPVEVFKIQHRKSGEGPKRKSA